MDELNFVLGFKNCVLVGFMFCLLCALTVYISYFCDKYGISPFMVATGHEMVRGKNLQGQGKFREFHLRVRENLSL